MKKILLTGVCFVALSTAFALTPTGGASATSILVVVDDPVDLNQYVGKYKFEGLPFEYLTISLKDGKLIANTGVEEAELTSLKEADSFDAAGRAVLKFNRGTDKKVTGISMDAEGSRFEGKKES